MSRLSFILFLLLASTSAHAQGGLHWLADSVVLHQVGCMYAPDSLTASFVNNSSKPLLLDTINGPTSSWVIDQPSSFTNLLVAPGSVHTVKLYLKIPNRYRNERLVLNAADGTKDTLKLREDLQTSQLTAVYGDTLRYLEVRALGAPTATYYGAFSASGNVAFVVSSIQIEGDTTFRVIRSGPDTLRPYPNLDRLSFQIPYSPIEYGSDTLRITLSGSPCDSLYRFVLIVETIEPSAPPQGVRWDYRYLTFSSRCGAMVSADNRLLNTGESSKSIDSLRIVGDPLFSLISSTPPGRFANFILSPGDSVTYSIAFGGSETDLLSHAANLIAYGPQGNYDTVRLTGTFLSSGLRTTVSDYDLGQRYVGEIWEVFTWIDRTGQGNFVISDIEKEGTLNITYEGIEIGKVINGNKLLYLSATSALAGPQEGALTIYGAECDTIKRITFRGNFTVLSSVDDESSESCRLLFDGKYLIDLRPGSADRITVYDMTGREMISSSQRQIDLSSLPTGTYIAITESSRKLKFVK